MYITLIITAIFGGLFTAFRPRYGPRFVSVIFCGVFFVLIGSFAALLGPEEQRSSIDRITDKALSFYVCVAVLILTIEMITNARQESHTERSQSPEPYPVTALACGGNVGTAVVDDSYRLVDPDVATITVTTINEEASRDFRRACERALARNDTKLCIELNTCGGFESDAYAMADIIRELDKTMDIYIRVLGHCMSAGNIILMSVPREKRVCSANSQFMLHTASSLDMYMVKEANIKRAKLLANGTFLSEARLAHLFNSKQNCYLTAEEALERGIIGAIR